MKIEFGSPEAQAILEADKELKYERRTQVAALVSCECGKEVELIAETEEWTESDDGESWEHSEFGPGSGQCDCGRIYVEDIEGRVLMLRPAVEAGPVGE